MRNLTLADIEQLRAEASESDVALEMDEEAFCAFYERTARVLQAYLSRVTGDGQLADDLLQETYYRFLRARVDYESEAHRRNSLFRIASNLVRDHYRRRRVAPVLVDDVDQNGVADPSSSAATERGTDLKRAMARLRPRDRELLWLAYAQGSSHREIADSLGLKAGSIKMLLFRARRRLANLLRGNGYGDR
jgi:RNA polymerase sigma-70 factor (ECF subfamily)